MLRLLVFNRSYPPDVGATGRLLGELCEDLVARHGFGRRRVGHGLPGVAERLVHRVGQRVHASRLRIAGDDDRSAARRRQILGDRVGCFAAVSGRRAVHTADPDALGQGPGERVDLARFQRHAVIRLAAGQ